MWFCICAILVSTPEHINLVIKILETVAIVWVVGNTTLFKELCMLLCSTLFMLRNIKFPVPLFHTQPDLVFAFLKDLDHEFCYAYLGGVFISRIAASDEPEPCGSLCNRTIFCAIPIACFRFEESSRIYYYHYIAPPPLFVFLSKILPGGMQKPQFLH